MQQNKSMGDLGREAMWFAGHSAGAIAVVFLLVLAVSLTHPSPDAVTPKVLLVVLSFAATVIAGALITRLAHNNVGRLVWLGGLLIFMAACVWVIDLPTGPGLCEECGPGHLTLRLWRTFFDFSHGSGLMGGAGPLVGCWIPIALVGYALGARMASEG